MTKNNSRFAAKALIFFQGKYLLALRSGTEKILPSMWDIPGGGAEAGETILETLIREIKEETGIDISSSKIFFLKNWTVKNDKITINGRDFLCILENCQKVKLSPEHSRAEWLSEKEIMKSKEIPEWIKESVKLASAKLNQEIND